MSVEIASAICSPIIVSAMITPVPNPARTHRDHCGGRGVGLRRKRRGAERTMVTSSASAPPRAAIGANCASNHALSSAGVGGR